MSSKEELAKFKYRYFRGIPGPQSAAQINHGIHDRGFVIEDNTWPSKRIIVGTIDKRLLTTI